MDASINVPKTNVRSSTSLPSSSDIFSNILNKKEKMSDDEGREVEERTFCFGTLSITMLASMWIFGHAISVEDLYLSVAVAVVYAVTIPVSDPQAVSYAVLCTLFPMWLASPLYLLDWNTMWQQWPNPTAVAIIIGYIAYWIHHFSLSRKPRRWHTEKQYDNSFSEIENRPESLGTEE